MRSPSQMVVGDATLVAKRADLGFLVGLFAEVNVESRRPEDFDGGDAGASPADDDGSRAFGPFCAEKRRFADVFGDALRRDRAGKLRHGASNRNVAVVGETDRGAIQHGSALAVQQMPQGVRCLARMKGADAEEGAVTGSGTLVVARFFEGDEDVEIRLVDGILGDDLGPRLAVDRIRLTGLGAGVFDDPHIQIEIEVGPFDPLDHRRHLGRREGDTLFGIALVATDVAVGSDDEPGPESVEPVRPFVNRQGRRSIEHAKTVDQFGDFVGSNIVRIHEYVAGREQKR